MDRPSNADASGAPPLAADDGGLPSWVVGVCGVAAFASVLFTVLLSLNR